MMRSFCSVPMKWGSEFGDLVAVAMAWLDDARWLPASIDPLNGFALAFDVLAKLSSLKLLGQKSKIGESCRVRSIGILRVLGTMGDMVLGF